MAGGNASLPAPVRPLCIIGHFRFQVPFYFPSGRFKGQNTRAAEQTGVFCHWSTVLFMIYGDNLSPREEQMEGGAENDRLRKFQVV